ncbi:protein phosphatase Slingshot homolog 3 isoform X1 [Pangasianodon hypophthalmus]|uniref:protein phosphatase Slingshot homolog 3 isoform X1 n=1 Tax=Pangasianodon hypophthalmus TaxID=310915 RepID=UPI002306E155|nr:protein phosphatase Slingshot homolog 3 isoform X1 [Pangasianodon hypophthalmus]XP_026803211.2 protein phosphatase Slingshot homolog 3 isoform X1 [Pangasianodon hypophthalmus]XP_034162046.2 protein phosphatase Slingshot homolog 3 isoform X1 [Pangasianodon hypophthalmus]
MALLTLHRSPSVSTAPDETIARSGRLQKRESFAFVRGAVLLLEDGAREGPNEEATPSPLVGGASDTKRKHLHAMISLLRPEDTVKLAVRLESVSPVRVRYLLVVTTTSNKQESLLLGMDFPNMNSDDCTIGLVLPIWSDTQVYLDGDGGFSVTSAECTRIFKPVSIQTMWSVLQALHGCCERAVQGAMIPGCGLDWAQHYKQHVESDQQCVNEWRAMTGLESVRKDNKSHSTERERVEREIKVQLRDIMRTVDLENITSKQIRSALEAKIGLDMKNYKEYIDNEMMVTMAQMDKPSKILDYLYLGSEWNAANFEELQKNNVGYILNVTMEIDNFFPESYTYMNIRVYDVESTDLLSHWNNTYMFINEARKSGQSVLVHCKMGVSRSASTVIAFLMKQQGWTLEDALNHVRERRPIVQPNDSFLKQLHTYSGILSASNQRHSSLWKRKSRSDTLNKPAQKQEQKAEMEGEQGDDEHEEEEDEESPEEEESLETDEDEERDVFAESQSDILPDAGPETTNPVITVQDSDKVTPSPSRSGRMDLFSLMQSIQLDDEERLSDLENAAAQRKSPAQRRRSSHKRRALTHQKAHVDVSPDPHSQSQSRKQEIQGSAPASNNEERRTD